MATSRALDPAARGCLLRVSVRPGDLQDLDRLAEAWGVTRSTAAWGILVDRLDRWRGVAAGFRGSVAFATVALTELAGRDEEARELLRFARARLRARGARAGGLPRPELAAGPEAAELGDQAGADELGAAVTTASQGNELGDLREPGAGEGAAG